jgi:predicted Zn-dependent protease
VSATLGPVARDPFLASGDGGSVDDLVAGLERGLLVSDFWYTRVVDPKRSVWTGLTRNGVWLVEDGRVVSPVSTLRFTQSYLEALAPGAVTVGSVVDPQPARLTFTNPERVAVPALRLAAWNITGNTTG